MHNELLPLSHCHQVHYVHVNEKHKNDITAALKDPEGLMVLGVFFDVKDKRTPKVK